MDSEKKRALEAAGWRFGDAVDFLDMSPEEREILEGRMTLALAVRRQREALKLSQKQLASRIHTSQPRVARIEQAAPDVSFDQLFRAFAALGGRITVRQASPSRKARSSFSAGRSERNARKRNARTQVAKVKIELIGTEL